MTVKYIKITQNYTKCAITSWIFFYGKVENFLQKMILKLQQSDFQHQLKSFSESFSRVRVNDPEEDAFLADL